MLFMKLTRRVSAWINRLKLVACTRASFKLGEFIIFALVVFFGGIIGNWLIAILGLSGGDIITQALVFLIPVAIIYYIWKKWGEKTAASM